MLTAYDASFAALAERAGVDVLLIGDSLGMVIQGHDTTLPVTLPTCSTHALRRRRCARTADRRRPALRQLSGEPRSGLRRRRRRAAAGAQMVKLEAAPAGATVEFLARAGAGVRPRRPAAAVGQRARRLSRAGQDRRCRHALLATGRRSPRGASLFVVECVPQALGGALTRAVRCRSSASARGRTVRDRCWCCTMRSEFSRAGPPASSAISGRKGQRRGGAGRVRRGGQGRLVPGTEHCF